MQRRGVVHFHVIRLDGINPDCPGAAVPPSTGLGLPDLVAAITDAAATTRFTTDAHPARPTGWAIG